MNVAQAIREAADRLAATSDTARLDAELLMAHALGVARSDLLLRHMDEGEPAGFAALIARRAGHEPVAHIIGRQEFYGLDFAVTRDTLIPRGDSETLVEAALAIAGEAGRALDLGTGSGALLLAFLAHRPRWTGVGIDASAPALAVARANAESLGLADRAAMRAGDWTEAGWAEDLGVFDLVLCNPPYVEERADLAPDVRDFEPAAALFAGPDGLDAYREIFPEVNQYLVDDGAAIFEIGHRQGEQIEALAEANGLACELRRDLGGRHRVAILRRKMAGGVGKGDSSV